MRVLVTGANGFVGRHAVRALKDRGHDVVGAGFAPTAQDVGVVALDVRDAGAVRKVVEEAKPDAVLHLAAIAFLPQAKEDPGAAFAINAQGTLHVLSVVAALPQRTRCIVVSSSEVYGKATVDELPLRETKPREPVSIYGASKAAAEHLARAYAAEGHDVRVLRPFNHVGPGQDDRFVVASFARQVALLEQQGGGLLLHGNVAAIRDFTDVRDVAAFYAAALEAEQGVLTPGDPYNVCSGIGRTIESILQAFASRAHARIEMRVDPARLRAVDVPAFVGDATRLRAALRCAPVIPWETTLDDVLEDARQRARA